MLPRGRYASVTWSIRSGYGGMTKALLDRSAAFVRWGDAAVDVLTFDWRASYDGMREELEETGALASGVRVLNFWEELSRVPDAILREVASSGADAATDFRDEGARGTGQKKDSTPLTHRVQRSDGKIVKTFYRPDGSLLLAQEIRSSGDVEKQKVRIFLRDGTAAATYNSMFPAYYLWLDLWRGQDPAHLIIDSKFSANWLVDYERSDVVLGHLVHGSHLADGAPSPFGRWRTSRKKALIRARDFDTVCLLTHRQREDLAQRVGDLPNLQVVPNGFEEAANRAQDVPRESHTGVMVGSLSSRKRVDHALRALAELGERDAGQVALRIFGEGPEEERLRELATSLGIERDVGFRGFTDDADAEFSRASFSLLTSSSEGLPFALLESMSAGCIPIAYDIPYGPADMILDRVNGYLVPAGDIEGVAHAIREFLSLSEDSQDEMRSAARARVKQFGHPAVVAQWAEVFTEARERKHDASAVPRLVIRSARVSYSSNGEVILSCDVDPSDALIAAVGSGEACFALYKRGGDLYFRRRIEEYWPRGDALVLATDIGDGMRAGRPGTLDAFLEVGSGSGLRRQRIPFGKNNSGGAPYGTIHGNLSFHSAP